MTPDTCGRSTGTLFAIYDHDSRCWRTSQATVLSGLDEFSETWPRQGMTVGGRAFELPTSALPTVENECSSSQLLPTPSACVANDGEGVDTWLARRERVKVTANNGNGMGTPLTIAVQLLSTATVGDARNSANRTAGRSDPESKHHDGVTLVDAVRLLPTPTANQPGGTAEQHLARKQRMADGANRTTVSDLRMAIDVLTGESSALLSDGGNTSPDDPLPPQLWTDG